MTIKFPSLTVTHIIRLSHALVAIGLVACFVYVSRDLFINFYLPYSLEDAAVVPTTTTLVNPGARSLLATAELLKARQQQPALKLPSRDIFHEAPTSTAASSTSP